MRILIVTDAWFPQVNGVVRTYDTLRHKLKETGHDVRFVTPQEFRTVPCPTYPEISLALWPWRRMERLIEENQPCAIHIATEGPLGLAARRYCVKRDLPFTTAFHTKFPDYVHARFGIPIKFLYRLVRWFHKPSSSLMVATDSVVRELTEYGFGNIKRWSRGVDTDLFRPYDKSLFDHLERPVFAYVGRIAVEKNIEGFLSLDLPGTKVVIGDGPMMDSLKAKYPDVVFTGAKRGEDLARHYSASDCFVFPSKTDTFGLVLLEALACGIPVAALPVTGPVDVIGHNSGVGVINDDLAQAAREAVKLSPEKCRAYALTFSWARSCEDFVGNLDPFDMRRAWGHIETPESAPTVPADQTPPVATPISTAKTVEEGAASGS